MNLLPLGIFVRFHLVKCHISGGDVGVPEFAQAPSSAFGCDCTCDARVYMKHCIAEQRIGHSVLSSSSSYQLYLSPSHLRMMIGGEQQPIASRLQRLLLAEPGATCAVLEELFSQWDTTEAEMVGALSGYNSSASLDNDRGNNHQTDLPRSSEAGARSASQAVMEALLAYSNEGDALSTGEVCLLS